MACSRLQTCCCCASTRTGSITIAVLGIIMSIVTILVMWLSPPNTVKFSTFITTFDQHDIPRIIVTVNLCFTMLICGLLIVAIVKTSLKRRSWLMLPWVVLGVVLAIGLLISILHTSITYYLFSNDQDDRERQGEPPIDYTVLATVILIGGLLYLCFYMYLWTVVFSHYLDVRDDEERGRYRKAPYRR